MDRVRTYIEGDKQFRECVNCGFHDEMRLSHPGHELETRVNRTAEERADAVRPVKLLDK